MMKKKTCGEFVEHSLTDKYTTGDVSYLLRKEKKTTAEAVFVTWSFYHMINDDNIDKIYNSTATDISGDLELYYSLIPKKAKDGSANGDESLQYLVTGRSLIAYMSKTLEKKNDKKNLHQMHVLVEVVDGKEVMRVDNIMADVPADDRVRLVCKVFKLKNRLLIFYSQGRKNYSNNRIDWSANSAHLYRRTVEGVKLVDRIVASV